MELIIFLISISISGIILYSLEFINGSNLCINFIDRLILYISSTIVISISSYTLLLWII